jgi:hypothetical protein
MTSFNVNNFLQFDNKNDQDMVHLYDSRYSYPYSSPVNPNFKQSVVYGTSIPSSDLYKPIFKSDNPVNQFDYSGGKTQLLRIPLQMNEPNSDEMLRSQDILITPYNKIKYSNLC